MIPCHSPACAMQLFNADISDVHTHRRDAAGAIINLAPGMAMQPGLYYSAGIHPWDSEAVTDEDIEALRALVFNPGVIAVGECGIDRLRGAPQAVQRELFILQARMAEAAGKPLIIHVVRAIDDILAAKRVLRPVSPWIIHGFRGGPSQAVQLVRQGLYLSLGERFNPQTPAVIPSDRLLFETDTSSLSVDVIRKRVADARVSM